MSDNSLDGRYAVVTGGSQGLGEAVARLFAARGAAGIVLSGRDVARGEAVAADLEADGCRAYYVPGDLAEAANCRRVIATADERFGTLDVLVNAAAVTDRDSIWSASPEGFDRMMAVNARAPLLLMQDAIKLMQRERVSGSIVNISSVVTRCGPPFLTSYAMSKCALDALTRNVAYAVMHSRIRVNAHPCRHRWTRRPRTPSNAATTAPVTTGWRWPRHPSRLDASSSRTRSPAPLPFWRPTSPA